VKERRSDWIHWTLQLLCGLVAGALFGTFFVRGGRRGIHLIARELAPQFLLSMALLGGAVASTYGDRLWFGLTGRANMGDAPRHDAAMLVASLLVGMAGVVLALFATCKSLGIFE
jgi:hypothetical protein